MSVITQRIALRGSVFVDDNFPTERFIKTFIDNMNTWDGSDIGIEFVDSATAKDGSHLIDFYIDFYVRNEFFIDAPSKSKRYIVDGCWRDKNDATRDVIHFVESFGYEFYDYTTSHFDEYVDCDYIW